MCNIYNGTTNQQASSDFITVAFNIPVQQQTKKLRITENPRLNYDFDLYPPVES